MTHSSGREKMPGDQFANWVAAHKWHTMNSALLSHFPLHKKVGCCSYSHTKKEILLPFRKKKGSPFPLFSCKKVGENYNWFSTSRSIRSPNKQIKQYILPPWQLYLEKFFSCSICPYKTFTFMWNINGTYSIYF